MTKVIKNTKSKTRICAICSRPTYRMQHAIHICSYCEQRWKIEFNGRRELVDRLTGKVVQVLDPSKCSDDVFVLKEADDENI